MAKRIQTSSLIAVLLCIGLVLADDCEISFKRSQDGNSTSIETSSGSKLLIWNNLASNSLVATIDGKTIDNRGAAIENIALPAESEFTGVSIRLTPARVEVLSTLNANYLVKSLGNGTSIVSLHRGHDHIVYNTLVGDVQSLLMVNQTFVVRVSSCVLTVDMVANVKPEERRLLDILRWETCSRRFGPPGPPGPRPVAWPMPGPPIRGPPPHMRHGPRHHGPHAHGTPGPWATPPPDRWGPRPGPQQPPNQWAPRQGGAPQPEPVFYPDWVQPQQQQQPQELQRQTQPIWGWN